MWYRGKASIKLWPDMATSPEAPDHNASELCRATVSQQEARHYSRSCFSIPTVYAEISSRSIWENDMSTAVAASIYQPIPFPEYIAGGVVHQCATTLPMAYTIGGWGETIEALAGAPAPYIAESTAAANSADVVAPYRMRRGVAKLLRAVGEMCEETTGGEAHRMLLQAGEFCVECVQAPSAGTMAQIFEGHHRIAEAMRQQQCSGRWQIWINRHYRDGDPIDEVCDYINSLSGRAITTGVLPLCPKGVGVVVSEYRPEKAERVHRRSVLPLYDMNVQRPKSLIMNGGLSLHIEGPFFHRYEPIETLLNNTSPGRGTTILAVESDDPGEMGGNGQMQTLLDSAPPAIGGILLVEPQGEKRDLPGITGVFSRQNVRIPVLELLARRIGK